MIREIALLNLSNHTYTSMRAYFPYCLSGAVNNAITHIFVSRKLIFLSFTQQ